MLLRNLGSSASSMSSSVTVGIGGTTARRGHPLVHPESTTRASLRCRFARTCCWIDNSQARQLVPGVNRWNDWSACHQRLLHEILCLCAIAFATSRTKTAGRRAAWLQLEREPVTIRVGVSAQGAQRQTFGPERLPLYVLMTQQPRPAIRHTSLATRCDRQGTRSWTCSTHRESPSVSLYSIVQPWTSRIRGHFLTSLIWQFTGIFTAPRTLNNERLWNSRNALSFRAVEAYMRGFASPPS